MRLAQNFALNLTVLVSQLYLYPTRIHMEMFRYEDGGV